MNKLKEHTVRMTLSMSAEFYDYLQELANREYLSITMFVKQLIMKSVLDGHYKKDTPEFNEIKKDAYQKYGIGEIMGKKKNRKNA